MVYKRKALRKRPAGVRRVAKRAYSKKPSVAVKQYVQRAISRSEETKMVSQTYELTGFNAQILSVADIITCLPPIVLGTSQKQRVGQKITPIRMEIRGYVCYNTPALVGNYDARMLGARMFVYQDKANKCYTQSAVDNYNLLNLGGTSSTFTGTPMNWITPNNKLLFNFYADKKMTLLKPIGMTNNSAPSINNGISGMDKSLFHPFTIILDKKKLPATLIYDEYESASYPINFAPKVSLGYCDLLNVAPDVVNQQIAMEFCCTLYYKDS